MAGRYGAPPQPKSAGQIVSAQLSALLRSLGLPQARPLPTRPARQPQPSSGPRSYRVPTLQAAQPEPKRPSFDTALAAAKGDPVARQKVRLYEQHQQAKRQGAQQTQAMSDRAIFGGSQGQVFKAAARAPLISPLGKALVGAASPVEAARSAYNEGRKGHYAAAGLSALGVLPIGRGPRAALDVGKAVRGERVAEDVVKAQRAAQGGKAGTRLLVGGDKAQQMNSARSAITRNAIEKPADAISRALPNTRFVGARARVAKQAGRALHYESGAAKVLMHQHELALPKEGSATDVAHFWWAQLPKEMRNREGLRAVRDAHQAALGDLMGGSVRTPRTLPESRGLLNDRKRAASLGQRFETAKGNRITVPYPDVKAPGRMVMRDVPRTAETVDARLSHLNTWIDKRVKIIYKNVIRADPGMRSSSIAKDTRPRREMTAEDKYRGVIGGGRALEPPDRGFAPQHGPSKDMARAEAMLYKLGSKPGAKPYLKEIAARIDERDHLNALKSENVPAVFREPAAEPAKAPGFGTVTKQQRVAGKTSPSDMPPRVVKGGPNVTRIGGALSLQREKVATGEARHAAAAERYATFVSKGEKAGRPEDARALTARIAQLDKLIQSTPTLNPRIIEAVHALSGERQKILESQMVWDKKGKKLVPMLDHARAEERKGLVAKLVGATPTGEEAFIGHRLDIPRGAFGLRSKGLGKAKYPEGVGGENKLIRVKTGAVRQSTHVAAADWRASHTYVDATRARKELAAQGAPYEGKLPADHSIVNPEGAIVSSVGRTDRLAKAAADGNVDELRAATEETLKGWLGDSKNWEHVVEEAKKTGSFDKLRVVPNSVVDRYYAQFLPMGKATKGGRIYDRLIDATAASLIFARIGYVPKNIAQNLVMAVPHQGPFLFANVPRAVQLTPHAGQSELDRQLWDLLAHATGGGASGAVSREASSRILGAPAQVASSIADSHLRISAILNEAAAEKVIPRLSVHLSEKDKQALLAMFTDPAKRPLLNNVIPRGVDAMGDFNRLTPVQRRWTRRFLIVPSWLAAGTRYPFHFAATHPLRSAALAYAGAGEPGAPKRLQVNKRLDKYLVKGLPSYIQGVSAAHLPHALGGGPGKVFRIQSLAPASLPWDIANSLRSGQAPLSAASYANPLPVSAYNTAQSVYQTASGETRKTSFLDAAKRNLTRLAPGEQFVQHEISPPSGANSIYPDKSRLGLLAKEAGVIPLQINRSAAQRAAFSEQGMTQSVHVVNDKTDLLKKIQAAGEEPSKALTDAYDLRLERANRLDKIHAHGLTYQQKAYKADVALLLQRGLIDKQEADATLREAAKQDEATLRSWRTWLTANKFGGGVIRDVKRYLAHQSKG